MDRTTTMRVLDYPLVCCHCGHAQVRSPGLRLEPCATRLGRRASTSTQFTPHPRPQS
ncbi:hypothetical protein BGY98DRAFT_1003098, partial [Russula aff. rugulosa BPL654]